MIRCHVTACGFLRGSGAAVIRQPVDGRPEQSERGRDHGRRSARVGARGSALAGAQPTPCNLKYRTGQTVQPIFEGWSRKADGGFTMHFGYFNRNFVEEVHVAVGPDNHFEPVAVTVR